LKHAATGKTIDKGTIKIFGASRTGDGTTEEFFKIEFTKFKVVSATIVNENSETLLEVIFDGF